MVHRLAEECPGHPSNKESVKRRKPPVKSLVITFAAPGKVELREEQVPDPGPREILVETTRSLISTGTEGSARGD